MAKTSYSLSHTKRIVLSHKKARGSQLWNSSFLSLSRSLIVFKKIIGHEH